MSRLVRRLLEFQANPNLQTLPPDSVIMSMDDGLQTSYRLTPLHTAIINKQESAVNAMLHYHSKLLFRIVNFFVFLISVFLIYINYCFINFRYNYSRTQRRIFYYKFELTRFIGRYTIVFGVKIRHAAYSTWPYCRYIIKIIIIFNHNNNIQNYSKRWCWYWYEKRWRFNTFASGDIKRRWKNCFIFSKTRI